MRRQYHTNELRCEGTLENIRHSVRIVKQQHITVIDVMEGINTGLYIPWIIFAYFT